MSGNGGRAQRSRGRQRGPNYIIHMVPSRGAGDGGGGAAAAVVRARLNLFLGRVWPRHAIFCGRAGQPQYLKIAEHVHAPCWHEAVEFTPKNSTKSGQSTRLVAVPTPPICQTESRRRRELHFDIKHDLIIVKKTKLTFFRSLTWFTRVELNGKTSTARCKVLYSYAKVIPYPECANVSC